MFENSYEKQGSNDEAGESISFYNIFELLGALPVPTHNREAVIVSPYVQTAQCVVCSYRVSDRS